MDNDSFLNGFEFTMGVLDRLFGLNLYSTGNYDKLKRHLQQVLNGEIIPSEFAADPRMPPGTLIQMFPNFDANYKESAARALAYLETCEQ